MKKILLFTAILFASITMGSAQSNTGTAQLTIKLNPIQAIVVSGDVVINYNASIDYSEGKESTEFTTLTVVSAGGFAIRVEADNLTSGTSKIESENIKVIVEATESDTNTTYDTSGTLVKSQNKTALIASTVGGVNKQYKVKYKGDGNNKYIKKYNSGTGQSYTTTVHYTITPN